MQELAKEAQILKMVGRFLAGRAQQDISSLTGELLDAAKPFALETVARACASFYDAELNRNHVYPPNAVEFMAELKRQDAFIQKPPDPADITDMRNLTPYRIGDNPPDPLVPAGLISIDFGSGRIDLTKLSHHEQEEVLKAKGIPARLAKEAVQPRLRGMR